MRALDAFPAESDIAATGISSPDRTNGSEVMNSPTSGTEQPDHMAGVDSLPDSEKVPKTVTNITVGGSPDLDRTSEHEQEATNQSGPFLHEPILQAERERLDEISSSALEEAKADVTPDNVRLNLA